MLLPKAPFKLINCGYVFLETAICLLYLAIMRVMQVAFISLKANLTICF